MKFNMTPTSNRKSSVSWSWFWHRKFKQQLTIIESRAAEELSREEPEIALGYFFLYQWLESFVDDVVRQFQEYVYPMESVIRFEEYKGRRLYFKGKVEFLFDNFCSELPYSDYLKIKKELQPLNNIRNLVVHLHEISWLTDEQTNAETPKSNLAKISRREGLNDLYLGSLKFLILFKKILLKSQIGRQEMSKRLLGIEIGKNLVEQVFEVHLPDEVKELMQKINV